MKVIGKRVFLTKKEIREAVSKNKRFKKFHEENKGMLENTGGRFIFLYRYLKSEGWDFTKKGKQAMPEHLWNTVKHPPFYIDDNGEIIYL